MLFNTQQDPLWVKCSSVQTLGTHHFLQNLERLLGLCGLDVVLHNHLVLLVQPRKKQQHVHVPVGRDEVKDLVSQ